MREVPIRLVEDEDDPGLFLPFVELVVGGVPVEALLDSGAARTQVVERPGLRGTSSAAGNGQSSAVFGGEMSDVQSGVVPVSFGGVDVGPVDVRIVPPNHAGEGDLVGQDVLARFRCGYRLRDGLLLLDPELPPDSHPIVIGERGHVYLDVTWDAVDTRADSVFDTGASVTVVDRGFADRHPDLFEPVSSSTGTDATGTTVETPTALMRGPRLLGTGLADLTVAIVDLDAVNRTAGRRMDVILGWTVIAQASWVIDHATARAACG